MRRLLPINGWAGIDPSRAKRRSVLRFNLTSMRQPQRHRCMVPLFLAEPHWLLELPCLSNLSAGRGTAIVSGLDESLNDSFSCAASIQ